MHAVTVVQSIQPSAQADSPSLKKHVCATGRRLSPAQPSRSYRVQDHHHMGSSQLPSHRAPPLTEMRPNGVLRSSSSEGRQEMPRTNRRNLLLSSSEKCSSVDHTCDTARWNRLAGDTDYREQRHSPARGWGVGYPFRMLWNAQAVQARGSL